MTKRRRRENRPADDPRGHYRNPQEAWPAGGASRDQADLRVGARESRTARRVPAPAQAQAAACIAPGASPIVLPFSSHPPLTVLPFRRVMDSFAPSDAPALLPPVFPPASTSGRVASAFWPAPRPRPRPAWSSPPGVFYVIHRPDAFLYCELEQGRKLEESVSIDINHSVSTCFEQGRLGEDKSILMSSSHKLDANNMLTTHYVNNLNGGEEFTCSTSHSILSASRLSTCFHVASIGDPTLEVELEQENETKKISETFLANLRTGERLLRLHSKTFINDTVALSNTYITNLRGQHSVRLEAALPLWGVANISKSFTTDFQRSHEFCLKTQQQISERNIMRTAFIRNLHHNSQVSVEFKHVAQGRRDVAVKLLSNLHGTTQFEVTTSHTRQANCWGWTFRKVSGEAHSVGVEWKREVASEKFLLLRTSTQDRSCTVYAELRRSF